MAVHPGGGWMVLTVGEYTQAIRGLHGPRTPLFT